jgi:endo-1,4-beta-xylanase
VQSHIGVYGGSPGQSAARQEGEWRRFLDAVVAMGYKLVITEFDVNDSQLPSDPKVRDAAVAAYADAYLEIMFGYSQLRDVLVWGMSDKYGWLNGFNPRADRTWQRATPYDDKFQAKPLRDVFARRFAATAARPA